MENRLDRIKKQLNKEQQRGLTIIELVISIFILVVAVIGVYNAFSVMSVATAQMSNRFTAAYLAQEGIEIIRNMRDNNWLLDKENWSEGLADGVPDCRQGCQADFKTPAGGMTAFGLGTYLNIDSNGFYSYSPCSGEVLECQTKFTREIKIRPISDASDYANVLEVSVTVYWGEKETIANSSAKNSITAVDYLYDWY